MTNKDAIRIYLTKVRDEIFRRQRALGIRASGFSDENTKVVVNNKSGGYLNAPLYLYTNFKGIGRKPGTMPPIKSIQEWIKQRALKLNAWAVAMSIKKKGTRIFYDRRRGIDFISIQQKYMDEFLSNIASVYVDKIKVKRKQDKGGFLTKK